MVCMLKERMNYGNMDHMISRSHGSFNQFAIGAPVPFTTMPRPFDIPELLDHIISHLPDDKQDLRACALVARMWTHPSRTRLYGQLNCGRSPKAGLALANHLQTCPVIGQYIRELNVANIDYSKIMMLAGLTPSLRTLTVRYAFGPLVKSDRPSISPLISGKSIRIVSLICCTFRTASDFYDFILQFPTLHKLSLSVNVGPYAALGSSTSRISAHELLVRRFPTISSDIAVMYANFLDHHSPRILDFVIDDQEQLDAFLRLCNLVGPRIEELHVTVGFDKDKGMLLHYFRCALKLMRYFLPLKKIQHFR